MAKLLVDNSLVSKLIGEVSLLVRVLTRWELSTNTLSSQVKRSGRSVCISTRTSPRTPCGRNMRPMTKKRGSTDGSAEPRTSLSFIDAVIRSNDFQGNPFALFGRKYLHQ